MKPIILVSLLVFSLISLSNNTFCQDSLQVCKVLLPEIQGLYSGDCKNGMAHGKGESKGINRYVGSFKNGLPNGKGTYYFNDSIYHTGNFLDGIKEGKGESHFLSNGKDSVIKGYWSGDIYRGNTYVTYKFFDNNIFDNFDIIATGQSGNTITIEISSSTFNPSMNTSITVGMPPLLVQDLFARNGDFVRKVSYYHNSTKSSITYQLLKFPTELVITFTNGKRCELELYKSANWTVKLYTSK